MSIAYQDLRRWVQGEGAAIRVITELQPAGGNGDKLFPPTYEGGSYILEQRRTENGEATCVLLDSVQSQANRFEEALLDARRRGLIRFPDIEVDFAAVGLPQFGRLSVLELPHRIYDAILRDSQLNGTVFRVSPIGIRVVQASPSNATALLEHCPPVLIFGAWDSTGFLEGGGLGNKFARTLVSEIVGFSAVLGKRAAVRVDPLGIQRDITIYKANTDVGWTTDANQAEKDNKGNPIPVGSKAGKEAGRPSIINHGNIITGVADGGVTIETARQTTVLSLAGLRRLRFPRDNGQVDADRDAAARCYLATLALSAVLYQQEQFGYALRSRCDLAPVGRRIEMVPNSPRDPDPISTSFDDVQKLYEEAEGALKAHNFEWDADATITLVPTGDLTKLVEENLKRLQA